MRRRNDASRIEQAQKAQAFNIESYSSPATHRASENAGAVFMAFIFALATCLVLCA